MAGKNSTKNIRSNKGKSKSIFADEKFKITLGLIVSGFSIFLFISMVSYIFTWKTDQSFEWSKVISNPDFRVENWAGKAGAYFSNQLINRWFGVSSFCIPFLLILTGLKLMHVRIASLFRIIRIALVGMLLLSIWLGYVAGEANGYLGSGLGGKHGLYLSEWLKSFVGTIGTAMVLILTTLIWLFFSNSNILRLTSNIVSKKFLLLAAGEKTMKESPAFRKHDTDEQVQNDLVFETEFNRFEAEGKSPGRFTPGAPEEDIELLVEKGSGNGKQDTTEAESYEMLEDYDPTLDLPRYAMPSLDLLEKHDVEESTVTNEELISNKNKIVETLAHYKIQIDKIKATIGPTVTLYEIVPAPGVRISKIKSLEDDIALSLAALGIRIIAPMPGKGTIGIEVPNQNPEIVSMRSVLSSRKFQENNYELPIAIGKTISNETYVFDLAKMPHLLLAGATGQGKSVGLNCIITSLLYKKHPSQLKFVLVDPKRVELTAYTSLEKHYLAKIPDSEEIIITDTKKVIYTLNSLTIEMDSRYQLLEKAGVRNIREYNHKFIKRQLNPEHGHRYLPYIVVIVDEFADLIMTAGKEVETPLARLAQLARAIGIHLVIATQRPTTNIITGVIKANFPARIAFRVTSMVDSRTILDVHGANQLIGRGDMLLAPGSEMIRIQCAFIDVPEIERITKFISAQKGFLTAMYLPEYIEENASSDIGEVDLSKRDALFGDAARLVVIHQQGSTSLIQRKFSIGYNRAGRIMDQLEAAGIVGPPDGSKPRQVFFPDEYSLEQYLSSLNK
ncbi:MAG: DNA translocase FtsK 4TM domain-containing protein [Bacteroidales bacterium]|nr:DNA translocase FtsK 4TM domain-containing protein [Bacteroidales bacterium]